MYVLAGAILCGPAGLAISLTRGSATAPAAAAVEDPNRDARRAAAQDVAARWTRAFLSTPAAQADRLQLFWPGPLTLPSTAASVGDATAMDATAAAPGVWTVTVALDVTPAGGAATRRYFQVPVAVAGGTSGAQAKPLTVPAEISGPGVAAPGALAYPITVSSTGAAGVAVHGFLSAYLAGTGDLTRWSAPALSVNPVTPAPYGDVQVAQLQASDDAAGLSNGQPSDGTAVHLLATVAMRLLATEDGQADAYRTGQYLLTVTARAGRWEVSAIDTAPVVANTSSSTSAASSTGGSPGSSGVGSGFAPGPTRARQPRAGHLSRRPRPGP